MTIYIYIYIYIERERERESALIKANFKPVEILRINRLLLNSAKDNGSVSLLAQFSPQVNSVMLLPPQKKKERNQQQQKKDNQKKQNKTKQQNKMNK